MITVRIPDRELKRAREQGIAFTEKRKAELQRQVVESTLAIHREARSAVSVDTGRLRSSVTLSFSENNMAGAVGTDVHYAPYVEFGTGSGVSIPRGLESYAASFRGRGLRDTALPARPFLFPAFERQRKRFLDAVRRIFRA